MPIWLKRFLVAEVVLALVLAVVLPAFESGAWRGIVFVLSLLPAIVCVAFWQRVPFSDITLRIYCLTAVVLGFLFVALQLVTTSSVLLTPSNLLMIAETLVAGALYLACRSETSKYWFRYR